MPTPAAILRAHTIRHAAPPPERRLWTFLRTLHPQGHHFRRQAPFRGYILDFVSYPTVWSLRSTAPRKAFVGFQRYLYT